MRSNGARAILLLFLMMLSARFWALEGRSVRVGAFNNYPVIFRDADGTFKGLYVDLLAEIGKRENIQFSYAYGSWDEGLARIKSGEVDMLTSVAFTPERAAFMDYCETPVLTVWGELYAPESSGIGGILDIAGKKIGVMKNDINGANFRAMTGTFNIACAFTEYGSYPEVFAAVAAGEVDAGAAGITFGAANQKQYGLRATGIVFNPLNLYFTSGKNKNGWLLPVIDSYLSKWEHQEESALSAARQKWLFGSAYTVSEMPGWLKNTFTALGLLIAAGLAFILLLRRQVRKATEQYRESEEIFDQFMKHSPVYVFFKDAEIRAKKLSANYEQMLGKPMDELLDKNMFDLFPSDLAKKMIEDDKAILQSGAPVTFEEEFDGHHFSTTKFSFQTAGKKKYLAGFTIDVTGQKQSEEKIRALLAEKELLLKEVHHRIKNNMTTIKGLLSLQIEAEQNPSAAESLKDAESRVQSIILLYDRLYCTDNYRELSVREYIEPLAADIIHSFPNGGSVALTTDIGDFVMKIRLLSPLGIIINELLTNMMKHAFAGRESGTIHISASIEGSHVRIILEDNGVGMPEAVNFDNTPGFGMQIVKMLAEQIECSPRIERNGGSSFILEFDT